MEGAGALSAEEAGRERPLRERVPHQRQSSRSNPTPLTARHSPPRDQPTTPPHLLMGSSPARCCPCLTPCPGTAPPAPRPTGGPQCPPAGKSQVSRQPSLHLRAALRPLSRAGGGGTALSGCGLAETCTGLGEGGLPSGRALSLGPGPPPGGSAEEEGAPQGRAAPSTAPE